jgi:hypothetical protein
MPRALPMRWICRRLFRRSPFFRRERLALYQELSLCQKRPHGGCPWMVPPYLNQANVLRSFDVRRHA